MFYIKENVKNKNNDLIADNVYGPFQTKEAAEHFINSWKTDFSELFSDRLTMDFKILDNCKEKINPISEFYFPSVVCKSSLTFVYNENSTEEKIEWLKTHSKFEHYGHVSKRKLLESPSFREFKYNLNELQQINDFKAEKEKGFKIIKHNILQTFNIDRLTWRHYNHDTGECLEPGDRAIKIVGYGRNVQEATEEFDKAISYLKTFKNFSEIKKVSK